MSYSYDAKFPSIKIQSYNIPFKDGHLASRSACSADHHTRIKPLSHLFPEIFLDDEDRNRVIRGTERDAVLRLFPCTLITLLTWLAPNKVEIFLLVFAAFDYRVSDLMYYIHPIGIK